jgi:hypothetical protein
MCVHLVWMSHSDLIIFPLRLCPGSFKARALIFWGDGETGISNQGFVIAKQALYHLNHTSSPFCFGYFGAGVLGTVDRALILIWLLICHVVLKHPLALLCSWSLWWRRGWPLLALTVTGPVASSCETVKSEVENRKMVPRGWGWREQRKADGMVQSSS